MFPMQIRNPVAGIIVLQIFNEVCLASKFQYALFKPVFKTVKHAFFSIFLSMVSLSILNPFEVEG